jgi:hypothetical protein
MEDGTAATGASVDLQVQPRRMPAFAWNILWFFLHLSAVYASVKLVTPWLGGWVKAVLLPLLQVPTSSGDFQFLF